MFYLLSNAKINNLEKQIWRLLKQVEKFGKFRWGWRHDVHALAAWNCATT